MYAVIVLKMEQFGYTMLLLIKMVHMELLGTTYPKLRILMLILYISLSNLCSLSSINFGFLEDANF